MRWSLGIFQNLKNLIFNNCIFFFLIRINQRHVRCESPCIQSNIARPLDLHFIVMHNEITLFDSVRPAPLVNSSANVINKRLNELWYLYGILEFVWRDENIARDDDFFFFIATAVWLIIFIRGFFFLAKNCRFTSFVVMQ